MKVLLVIILFVPCIVLGYNTSASCTVLMNMDNLEVIYGEDLHLQRPVASISKIMTAILAIESGKLDDVVTIGNEISGSYGSGIYIKEGEEISLRDLVYGLMLRSGNDASLAIANYVTGDVDSFISLMNSKSLEIGMKNSVYNNPNGLDDDGGNLSTAYDMALLTSYAMKNEIYKEIVSTQKHVVKTNMNTYSWTNKHRLLFSNDYVTGGKTGFTDVAKRTLVTTASLDGVNLVVVTLNDGNDFVDHIDLFDEAFSRLYNKQILEKGNIDVINDEYYDDDTLYVKNDFYYTFSKENNDIVLDFKLEKLSNYVSGDIVGVVNIVVNGETVGKENIYVEKYVKKNLFERILNFIFND